MLKMSLGHLTIPESKEAVVDYWGYVKMTQEAKKWNNLRVKKNNHCN